MLSVVEMRQLLDEAGKLKGEEKLGAMMRLRAEIERTEKSYGLSFDRPFGELTEIRKLLPDIDGSINRLESAKRRKLENANGQS